MLSFDLERPVRLNFAGEFVSPEKGWRHLTRVLTDYELMIVSEGELLIGNESENFTVRAGEYLIMSPTRYQHGTAECRCRFYWVHFSAPTSPESLSLPPQGGFSDGEKLAKIMKALFSAESEKRGGLRSGYIATTLLFELASENRKIRSGERAKDAAHALCERVKLLAFSKSFTELRVSELASELGYHEKYLSAVFRKTEGKTLKQYLSALRLGEAKRLLLETNFTVAEVAYCLNFDDPHNFSRFFKREEGVTPTEFRDSKKPQTG